MEFIKTSRVDASEKEMLYKWKKNYSDKAKAYCKAFIESGHEAPHVEDDELDVNPQGASRHPVRREGAQRQAVAGREKRQAKLSDLQKITEIAEEKL